MRLVRGEILVGVLHSCGPCDLRALSTVQFGPRKGRVTPRDERRGVLGVDSDLGEFTRTQARSVAL